MDASYYGLLAAGVVLLVWYYIIYWQAERPKAGTLEWIDRSVRPRCDLSACGHALSRMDVLRALLPAVVAAASGVLQLKEETLYSGALGVLLRIPFGERVLYFGVETICAAIAAAAAYLLGKTLTGKNFAGFAGAMLYAVYPTDELFSALLLGGMLLLWCWAGFPVRGLRSWALLIPGAVLIGAAALSIYLYAVAAAFVATLLFTLIHRVRKDLFGVWYALLLGAAALIAAFVGFAAICAWIGQLPVFSVKLLSWMEEALWEVWEFLVEWLQAPILFDRLLTAPLLLSGLAPLLALWIDRRSGSALFLLLWALPITLVFTIAPMALPLASAALVCAYLTGRLLERGHVLAAVLGAGIAVATLALQELFWEVFSISFIF